MVTYADFYTLEIPLSSQHLSTYARTHLQNDHPVLSENLSQLNELLVGNAYFAINEAKRPVCQGEILIVFIHIFVYLLVLFSVSDSRFASFLLKNA